MDLLLLLCILRQTICRYGLIRSRYETKGGLNFSKLSIEVFVLEHDEARGWVTRLPADHDEISRPEKG